MDPSDPRSCVPPRVRRPSGTSRAAALRSFLVGILVLAAAGCGDAPSTPTPESGFRVALLTPGPITDDGWNASAYEGLHGIATALSATTRNVRLRSPSEFEGALRGFADRGFRLIFAHGFEFSDAVARVAPDAKDTLFVITSGVTVAENVSSIRFLIEEPAWQAGRLAAVLSHSGTIGVVGGVEIPPVKSAFEAFRAGARSLRPDADVRVLWVGNWEDVAAARQAALALLDQGADVLFHNADAAGLGVFNAAEERGVLAIGCNRDQNGVKPNTVIASVVLDVPEAFLRIAREVASGRIEGRAHEFDLDSGVVRLTLNAGMKASRPDLDWPALEAAASAHPPAATAGVDAESKPASK